MIDALLSKITGLFQKDFLFAAFLPALIFILGSTVTLTIVLGINAVLALVESWTILQRAMIATLGLVAMIVCAYILSALQTSFLHVWSGRSMLIYSLLGVIRVAESYQKWRFRRMRDKAGQISDWGAALKLFEGQVRDRWNQGTRELSGFRLWLLKMRVKSLDGSVGPGRIHEQLHKIIDAYTKYRSNDLTRVFYLVKIKLIDWSNESTTRIQTDTYTLDRRFGTLETVRATTLGNIIESYNQYSFKRYKIEGDIFWPRLRSVISPEYLALVQEPKIMLDFSLTMASLGVVYGFAVLLLGPWLWFNPWFWLPLAALGFITAFLFYRMSVSAAYQLGEMIRASFDLFRLDLIEALELPHPASLKDERDKWEKFSKLAVYGTEVDFAIRERAPASDSEPGSTGGKP